MQNTHHLQGIAACTCLRADSISCSQVPIDMGSHDDNAKGHGKVSAFTSIAAYIAF